MARGKNKSKVPSRNHVVMETLFAASEARPSPPIRLPSQPRITLRHTPSSRPQSVARSVVIPIVEEEVGNDLLDQLPSPTPIPETVPPPKAKRGRRNLPQNDVPQSPPPPQKFDCTMEVSVYLDGKEISNRPCIIDILSPNEEWRDDQNRWIHEQWLAWAQKEIDQEMEETNHIAVAPRKWRGFYGPQNKRKGFDISHHADWNRFESVLVSTRTKIAEVKIYYGFKYPAGSAPDVTVAPIPKAVPVRKVPEKRLLDSDDNLPPIPKRRTSTDKMRAELADREKAEQGTPAELAVMLKIRWECMNIHGCGGLICWRDFQGKHHPLMEKDVLLWARHIRLFVDVVTVDNISIELKASLLRRAKEKEIAKAKSNKAKEPVANLQNQQNQQNQQLQFGPQFGPQYPQFLPQFMPPQYMPPPQIIFMPPPTYYTPSQPQLPLQLPSLPSVNKALDLPGMLDLPSMLELPIRSSSPVSERVALDVINMAFIDWIYAHVPKNRRQGMQEIFDALKRELWSVEDLRGLSREDLAFYNLKSGALAVVVAQITPFKLQFKVNQESKEGYISSSIVAESDDLEPDLFVEQKSTFIGSSPGPPSSAFLTPFEGEYEALDMNQATQYSDYE